jgi:hypothetical protein
MRYQTASHEEWDNERCGEMISNTIHLVRRKVGQRREWLKASVDRLLSLAAAPTFAIMAVLAGIQDGGAPDLLCSAAHASPLSGMVPMYLLMSAFHSAPWLKLISSRQSGARRS